MCLCIYTCEGWIRGVFTEEVVFVYSRGNIDRELVRMRDVL